MKPPESFLEDSPAIESGEPTTAPAPITEDDLEGTYDFNSFLRNSAEDPTWNDIFEQTPANYAPTNDPWLPFENFPTWIIGKDSQLLGHVTTTHLDTSTAKSLQETSSPVAKSPHRQSLTSW
jgi:hypothetical protein